MAPITLNLSIPSDIGPGDPLDTSSMDSMKTIQCFADSISIINIEVSNDNGMTWVVLYTINGSGTISIPFYSQLTRANIIHRDYNSISSIVVIANIIPTALLTQSVIIDPINGTSNIDTSNMNADKFIYCSGGDQSKFDIQISGDGGTTWASIGELYAGEFRYISVLTNLIKAITIDADYRSTAYFVISSTSFVLGGDSSGHGPSTIAWFNPVKFGTINQSLDPYTYDPINKAIVFNSMGCKRIEVGYDINLTSVSTELNDRILVPSDNEGGIRVGIYYVSVKGNDATYEVWSRAPDCSNSSHFMTGKAVLITQEAFEVDPCDPVHESILYMVPSSFPFVMDTTPVQFIADPHAVRTNSDRSIYGHWTFKDGSLLFEHCGQVTAIQSTATGYHTQTLPDKDGTFAMLSDVGSFDEAAFRSAANELTETVYCNYQRFNSVGHPHPAWPHGVTTVGWVQSNFLPTIDVTEAQADTAITLSTVTPWQGVVVIDITAPSGVILPTTPNFGDVIDVVTSESDVCLLLDPGSGTINDYSGTYPITNGQQQRLICVNTDGPEWSINGIAIQDFNNACVAAAVRTSGLSSLAGTTSQKIVSSGTSTADLTTNTTRLNGAAAGTSISITVPDGLHPGQQHAFVLTNPQMAQSYTITPSDFCDGTSVNLNLSFDGVLLEWDSNCSKWFIVSYSGGATVS